MKRLTDEQIVSACGLISINYRKIAEAQLTQDKADCDEYAAELRRYQEQKVKEAKDFVRAECEARIREICLDENGNDLRDVCTKCKAHIRAETLKEVIAYLEKEVAKTRERRIKIDITAPGYNFLVTEEMTLKTTVHALKEGLGEMP
jgi:hypothetical protein